MNVPHLTFEFDPAKAAANLKKHGVSFDEARTVFNDPLAQTFPDELHSEDEDRSITLGLSSKPAAVRLTPVDREPYPPHWGPARKQH